MISNVKEVGPDEFPMYIKETSEQMELPKEGYKKLSDIPQGPGSKLDSDTLDGFQLSPATAPAPNTVVPLDGDGKVVVATIPSNIRIGGWVRFNGTGTPAIADSYNVTSITDNGTGDYTVNWTTAFSNANYCVVGSANNPNRVGIGTVLAGSVQVTTIDTTGVAQDPSTVCVMAIGDI